MVVGGGCGGVGGGGATVLDKDSVAWAHVHRSRQRAASLPSPAQHPSNPAPCSPTRARSASALSASRGSVACRQAAARNPQTCGGAGGQRWLARRGASMHACCEGRLLKGNRRQGPGRLATPAKRWRPSARPRSREARVRRWLPLLALLRSAQREPTHHVNVQVYTHTSSQRRSQKAAAPAWQASMTHTQQQACRCFPLTHPSPCDERSEQETAQQSPPAPAAGPCQQQPSASPTSTAAARPGKGPQAHLYHPPATRARMTEWFKINKPMNPTKTR